MNTITLLKSAIIGKIWSNSDIKELIPATITIPSDMTLEANQTYLLGNMSFKTDRNLVKPIEMKKDETLYLFPNTKRNGINDPDYSVSIKLPAKEADEIIEASKTAQELWRKNNPIKSV